MDFVDDIDAVFPLSGGIGHLVDDISDIVDAVVGGRVHFHHIQARIGSDCLAGGALAAGTAVLRVLTVHGFGEDLRDRRLARAPGSAEEIAVSDPPGYDLVPECPYDDISASHILKCARPVFSV